MTARRTTGQRAWYEDVPLPQLMRYARDVYRVAVREALDGAGCDDLPRNGGVVVAGLDRRDREPAFSPQADAVAPLGLSKQMASQLIDTLVLREYLERRTDPGDRRRMEVRLTPRGRRAARAIQDATEDVEAELAARITPDELRGLRAGLAAFRALHEETA
ncbi:MAG TPA: MarR family transcriptional regulator [Acidimicrobiales bacterium]|nr:MarR family transcriptional regulator [Acidimicrobiales bacterium]